MANQGYAFSLTVNVGRDESGVGIAYPQALFVVLDDNAQVVGDAMVIPTDLRRADTATSLRTRLVNTFRAQIDDLALPVEWMDEI